MMTKQVDDDRPITLSQACSRLNITIDQGLALMTKGKWPEPVTTEHGKWRLYDPADFPRVAR
jgi:hypothetical protein